LEPVAAHYKPSLLNLRKYGIYFDYFKEYVVCKDFKSLSVSLKYFFAHKLPSEDYNASSKMGDFTIRKGTTDFQFINYAYERKVKEYIQSNIDSFDVFIDVGACIGEYCIWLAKAGKKCIAVEPVNFEAVRKNVSLNKLEGAVQVYPCGLGSKKERVFFNIPSGLPSSSYRDTDNKNEPNVDINTLDEICKAFNIPDNSRILIKLDVEGMEDEVIAGGKEFIKKYKNLSFIYEHFTGDDYKNDKALLALAEFTFSDLDPVNRLAIKK
jgi:FkbM family methyltransferase